MFCFRDLEIIARYVNAFFAMYTSYLFISFQNIFNDFCCFRDLQIIARYVNAIFAMYTFYLFISFQSIFNDFCCSCMFITINSGSILFYLFIYCLSCLNINRVCKTFLFLYNCFTSFHLFDSLARTSC